ncbi:MAG: adenylyl-sulfate kinase [Oscillospiraceae bacterium]|nr:adenylyl-sulfate kinase [Oscillospiraceae bacterium]
MNIELGYINQKVTQNAAAYIQNTNAAYLSSLEKIAEDIKANREKRPIVLLSGPSGSGKTTSALMIEKMLDEQGVETHTLSLDNYFSPLTDHEKELFHAGKLDLESPKRVDSEFLTEQLTKIYNCEPVKLPTYDFRESTRVFDGKVLHRKPGVLVILEVIHSLNPDIIDFPDENTAKIYVSVRTRITQDGRELHPSKIRLMRRLVRDLLFRKRSFADTLMMYGSVEEGENKYIMPYKYRSTYDVDTFMAYEICAYQPFLIEAFREMAEDPLVRDMLDFLERTAALLKEQITPDSLVCEFIGNGQFNS